MAIRSLGTTLKAGNGASPEVFVAIASVRDINGPGVATDTEEATNHGSTGSWEEHIATILHVGTVDFELNFGPTDFTQGAATGILKYFSGRERRNYELLFPDVQGTTWRFPAYVIKFPVSALVKGALKATVSLHCQSDTEEPLIYLSKVHGLGYAPLPFILL